MHAHTPQDQLSLVCDLEKYNWRINRISVSRDNLFLSCMLLGLSYNFAFPDQKHAKYSVEKCFAFFVSNWGIGAQRCHRVSSGQCWLLLWYFSFILLSWWLKNLLAEFFFPHKSMYIVLSVSMLCVVIAMFGVNGWGLGWLVHANVCLNIPLHPVRSYGGTVGSSCGEMQWWRSGSAMYYRSSILNHRILAFHYSGYIHGL